MKKITLLFFLIINNYINAQQIATEDWITDLNFLKTELAKKHKNLFFKISKQEFENDIENIINSLDKDNDIETSLKLTQLIAKVGDTHTNLKIGHILNKRKTLPLGVISFKKGIYVSATSKGNYEILDKKLIAINNFKVETIIDSLKTLFVPENKGVINENVPRLISNHVILKHFGFSKPNEDTYRLTLQDISGNLTNYNLKEKERSRGRNRDKIYMKITAEKPFYMNGSRKIFKEKFFPKERIYFIQYNKCVSKETIEKYGNKEFAYRYPILLLKSLKQEYYKQLKKTVI